MDSQPTRVNQWIPFPNFFWVMRYTTEARVPSQTSGHIILHLIIFGVDNIDKFDNILFLICFISCSFDLFCMFVCICDIWVNQATTKHCATFFKTGQLF